MSTKLCIQYGQVWYAAEHLQDRVTIICGNALESDLATATAVFLYLLPKGMSRLLQKLQAELQPGCKVITYMFRYRCIVLGTCLASGFKGACLNATVCKRTPAS